MKLKIAILLFTLFSTISYAQNEGWGTYDLDSIVYLDMPGQVIGRDTMINNSKVRDMLSIDNAISFHASKVDPQKRFVNDEIVVLPHDKPSLKTLYQSYALIESELRHQDPSFSNPIEIQGLMGYKTIFENTQELPYLETYLFLINKKMYWFSYESQKGVNSTERDLFFNSIIFNDDLELEQYYTSPTASKTNLMWKIIIGFLAFSFLFRFFTKKKKKPKRIRID